MRRTNKKSGFTLVELMVVAAIIAILAAIIVPLLSSNKNRAIAAEAANICGTVLTEAKVYRAANNAWPTKTQLAAGTIDDEIDNGRYFTWVSVSVAGNAITVAGNGTTGSASSGFTDGTSRSLTLTDGTGYSGSMETQNLVAN